MLQIPCEKLCCVVMCCVVLCFVVLCFVVLCCVVLCCVVPSYCVELPTKSHRKSWTFCGDIAPVFPNIPGPVWLNSLYLGIGCSMKGQIRPESRDDEKCLNL